MSIKKITMALFALIIVMSMLFTACDSDNKANEDSSKAPTGTNEENSSTNDTECKHTQTKTVGQKDATCTESGYTGDEVCEECGATVKKGTETEMTAHTYDSGVITKPATSVSTGIMTYTCTVCSATTTETIPLAEVSYKSFGDLMEAVIEEFTDIESGRIVFDTNAVESDIQRIEITFDTRSGDRVAMLNLFSNTGEKATGYYCNGAFAVNKGDDGSYEITSIDDLMDINFEEFMKNMEASFAEVDAEAKAAFDSLADIKSLVGEDVIDEINKILAESGSEYTFDSLVEASKSVQGIYVYYCRMLGLKTSVEFPEGAPMGANIGDLLGLFMNAKETENGTCYTVDFGEYMTAIEEIVSWLEEKQNTTYADFLYEICGPAITQFYPELTDFSKLLEYVRTKYNGNVKLGTFIDALITAVEESGYTVEQVYAELEAIISEMTGQNVKIDEIVAVLSEATLDDIAKQIFGNEDVNMNMLYDMLGEFMTNTTLGDTVVESHYEEGKFIPETGEYIEGELVEITLSEKLAEMREFLNVYSMEGGISVTVNENGKITGFEYTEKTDMTPENDTFDNITSFIIQGDKDVTVALPEELESLGQE